MRREKKRMFFKKTRSKYLIPILVNFFYSPFILASQQQTYVGNTGLNKKILGNTSDAIPFFSEKIGKNIMFLNLVWPWLQKKNTEGWFTSLNKKYYLFLRKIVYSPPRLLIFFFSSWINLPLLPHRRCYI